MFLSFTDRVSCLNFFGART